MSENQSPALPELLARYDRPTPRYTSYPPVPYWTRAQFPPADWLPHVQNVFRHTPDPALALYVHLPYCEALCTYCGCNKRITVNHAVEGPYVDAVLKEWALYRAQFPAQPRLHELHLGGGTPTFFSPGHLYRLVAGLLENLPVADAPAFSFEAHPNSTTRAHLETLYSLGFRRLSLGVQDFDPMVQFIINRPQSVEQTWEVVRNARAVGYTSVNIDLIYGLPRQTEQSVADTFRHVLEMRPDRIAFYSYAHVPWKSPGQRRYTEADLPSAQLKHRLQQMGRDRLLEAGYIEIGMDHFALPDDELTLAQANGTLHRNFMGYTPTRTPLLIGLGASSISDAGTALMQNFKDIEPYLDAVNAGVLPADRGHERTPDELYTEARILDLMCRFASRYSGGVSDDLKQRLQPLAADGLCSVSDDTVTVTPLGRTFLRNLAAALDPRYTPPTDAPVFSRSI